MEIISNDFTKDLVFIGSKETIYKDNHYTIYIFYDDVLDKIVFGTNLNFDLQPNRLYKCLLNVTSFGKNAKVKVVDII